MPETKTETFCQICRHPSHVFPGHMIDCPVYTGEASRGVLNEIQQAAMQAAAAQQAEGALSSQGASPLSGIGEALPCRICGGIDHHIWAGPGGCPGAYDVNGFFAAVSEDGYEVAKIYRDAREKLLQELKVQVDVNRRLARDLMEARLELETLKGAARGV